MQNHLWFKFYVFLTHFMYVNLHIMNNKKKKLLSYPVSSFLFQNCGHVIYASKREFQEPD